MEVIKEFPARFGMTLRRYNEAREFDCILGNHRKKSKLRAHVPPSESGEEGSHPGGEACNGCYGEKVMFRARVRKHLRLEEE